MMKRWNMILIILTYSLVILGTFLTRSGLLSSVHAFSQSTIGPYFLGFIAITFFISLVLLLYRWNDLKSENQMTSVLSREALFLLNNLLFIGILVFCFWGVFFPLISEIFTGQQVTVGAPYYNQTTGPFFAGLLFLMGIAPLAAWRHSTAKTLGRTIWRPTLVSLVAPVVLFATGIHLWIALLAFWLVAFVACVTLYEYGRAVFARHKATQERIPVALWRLARRDRRRYGGYIIHLGVIMMALGIIGVEMFQTTTQGSISQGQSLTLNNYTVTYQSLSIWDTNDGRNIARAVVNVSKNGKVVDVLYPRRDYYYESEQDMTIPGVRRTMEDDLYVLLIDWQPISSQGATFKIYHNPLINWLWVGAFVFIFGTLIAAWPEREAIGEEIAITAHVHVMEI